MANYLNLFFTIFLSSLLISTNAFCETANSPAVSETAVQPKPKSDLSSEIPSEVKAAPSVSPELREARTLLESGKLLEARDKYRALLTQSDLPKDIKKAARKELDDLNVQILFSPIETEDSTTYTVKEGDNLHNIAKKYDTTVLLVKKSNHLKKDIIRAGQKLKISTAKFSLEVDKSDNTLKLISDGMVLKTYRVGTGADNSTPVGDFTITTKIEKPTWYHDGKAVPPDSPDNILGTRWMGFSLDSYGIHGTTLPETIGTQASSGCVRMYNQEVEELYTIVPVGTHVVVKD